MKKILLTIVVVLLSISSFAQEHLKFKGKSMDCTCREMQVYLTEQGFKIDSYEDGVWLMTGKFAGDDALIIINPSSNGKVANIIVAYEVDDNTAWKYVKTKLDNFETMLTEKYGKPIINKKKFDPIYKEGSGMEIYGFSYGSSEYALGWETKGGNIGMGFIAKGGYAAVSILYVDKINSEAEDKQAYDDL
jgi:hypothetical protein